MMSQQLPAQPASPPSLASSEWFVPLPGGHALHVRQVAAEGTPAGAPGILFLHGLCSDGRFFLDSRGEGPARYFLEQGFTAYVADLRGHGKSRWPERRAWDWNFDTYVREDAPALLRAVAERHAGPLFLVGYSMGGYAALASLGLLPDVQRRLAGVCVLSSAVNDFSDGGLKKVALFHLSRGVSGVLGRFPSKLFKAGPSDEPAGVMRQFSAWAPSGAFRSEDGATDYWEALGRVTLPVLVGVGEADVFHASPRRAEKLASHLGSADKTFLVCGRSHGFAHDFGHVDLVRGERARTEVLPRVQEWMRARAP